MSGLRTLTAAISLIIWSSCAASHGSRPTGDTKLLTIVGTMYFLEVEGGCWQFRSDASESYELIGELSNKLHVEGRRAKLKIKLRQDLASICMVGSVAEVVAIVQLF